VLASGPQQMYHMRLNQTSRAYFLPNIVQTRPTSYSTGRLQINAENQIWAEPSFENARFDKYG
jgi:hypothetical protein